MSDLEYYKRLRAWREERAAEEYERSKRIAELKAKRMAERAAIEAEIASRTIMVEKGSVILPIGHAQVTDGQAQEGDFFLNAHAFEVEGTIRWETATNEEIGDDASSFLLLIRKKDA